MKRRLRVCTSCATHVPVTVPVTAPCPFCGFATNRAESETVDLRDVVLTKGKSGVMIAALGLSMACGDAEPKPDNNNTTSTTNQTTGPNENPNITADYAGGPINIEPGFDAGEFEEDAGMSDDAGGPSDMG